MKKLFLSFAFFAALLSAAAPSFAQSASQAPGASADGAAQAADVRPNILDPVSNKRVAEIASQLRCLVCQNQSIADSNAELAMDLKKQVVKQVADGRTNDEIIGFMVQRYGDFVLYDPPFKLSTLILWVGPAAFFVIALAGLFYTLSQRRKIKVAPLTEEQKRRAAELLSGVSESVPEKSSQTSSGSMKGGSR